MTTPYKITEGLYQITRMGVNVFLIDDSKAGLTLIDAGMPGMTSLVLQTVTSLGRQATDIKHILISHADIDHVGSLKGLSDATGAEVYANADSIPYIESASTPPHLPLPMKLLNGLVQKIFQKRATVQHALADEQILDIARGIRVIAAPGHTPENVLYFWEREKVLFAPDLFFGTSGLGMAPRIVTYDMTLAKQSAKKVLALEPAFICVGHGEATDTAKSPQAVQNLLHSL